ncbi:MAG: glycine cleavage system protein GcvH [Planctomycetes bacterium]|nr:glycine cleavage system protein GcvH [Planctomycetota bacterium]
MDPKALRFADTHEWAYAHGDVITVGISDYAVEELHEITYVDLPSVGDTAVQGDSFGEIESVKTVAEINAPCDGEIVEINEAVGDDPEILAADPFGDGWLVRIKTADIDQIDDLMSHDQYQQFIEQEEEESKDEDDQEEDEEGY